MGREEKGDRKGLHPTVLCYHIEYDVEREEKGDRKGLHPTVLCYHIEYDVEREEKGDRKGLHPTPYHPRPYKDDDLAC